MKPELCSKVSELFRKAPYQKCVDTYLTRNTGSEDQFQELMAANSLEKPFLILADTLIDLIGPVIELENKEDSALEANNAFERMSTTDSLESEIVKGGRRSMKIKKSAIASRIPHPRNSVTSHTDKSHNKYGKKPADTFFYREWGWTPQQMFTHR